MKPFPIRRSSTLCAAVAGLTALTASPAAATEAPQHPLEIAAPMMQMPLPLLVELATGWVAADLGVPMPDTLPRVAFADAATMREIRAAIEGDEAGAATSGAELVGMYDTRSRTIFLPLGWTGRSTAEVSILVHEVVHHFQTVSGERFDCPAAREKLAYEVQGRWLESYGESLEATLRISPMYLLVATNCMF
jgi:hypothetical protein